MFVRIAFIPFILLLCFSCKEKKDNATSTENAKGIEHLDQLIKEDSTNAGLYYQRAKAYLEKKDIKSAASDIDEAIYLDSTKAGYYLVRGDIMFMINKTSETKRALEKCLELEPTNIDCNMKLAELYLYVSNYDKSISLLDNVLRADKYNAKAYFLKGMNFKEKGDTNTAISSLQTAVEQNPDYYDAYIQLGLLMAAKKNKLALDYFNNALNIRPQSTEALYNKAYVLQQMGDTAKAKQGYNIILQIDPDYADAHYNLGYIEYEYNGNYKAALEHFRKASQSDRNFDNAYYMMGLSLEALGNSKLAAESYSQALKINPENQQAASGLARTGGK